MKNFILQILPQVTSAVIVVSVSQVLNISWYY